MNIGKEMIGKFMMSHSYFEGMAPEEIKFHIILDVTEEKITIDTAKLVLKNNRWYPTNEPAGKKYVNMLRYPRKGTRAKKNKEKLIKEAIADLNFNFCDVSKLNLLHSSIGEIGWVKDYVDENKLINTCRRQ